MSNAYWEKLKQIKKNIYTQLKTNTNLQIDFQRLILVLNAAKVVTFFFSCGMDFQILGPKYDTDCLP